MVWNGKQTVSGKGPFVKLGEHAVVPREATLTFEGVSGSPDASMQFEIRDGRPECVEIVVRAKSAGRGIRSADLAMISIDTMTSGVFSQLGTIGVTDETAALVTARDVREARASRRGAITREEIEQVARIYRENLASGAPTNAVETLLGYTRRTAARRVKQAEEAGLLPATTPGKRRG